MKNKFEVNSQQKKIINLLEKFLNNKETILSRFFKKKKKNFVFILWKSRCWQNNVIKFCI